MKRFATIILAVTLLLLCLTACDTQTQEDVDCLAKVIDLECQEVTKITLLDSTTGKEIVLTQRDEIDQFYQKFDMAYRYVKTQSESPVGPPSIRFYGENGTNEKTFLICENEIWVHDSAAPNQVVVYAPEDSACIQYAQDMLADSESQPAQSTYNTLAEYLQFEKEDITQIAVGGCCSPDDSVVITERSIIDAIYQKLDTTYRYVETTVIPIGAPTVSFMAGEQEAGFGLYSDTKIYVSDPSRRSNVFVYELDDPSGIEYVKELVHPTSASQTDPT